jgi:hypothetical protein
MNAGNRARYSELMRSHGVAFADCTRPLPPAYQVPGDGHPNQNLNAIWARCIAKAIAPRLEHLEAGGVRPPG